MVVDRKFHEMEALEEEIIDAEEAILSNLRAFQPGELLHLRRDLLAMRKSLFYECPRIFRASRRFSSPSWTDRISTSARAGSSRLLNATMV